MYSRAILDTPIYDPVCLLLETPFEIWNVKDQIDLINKDRPRTVIMVSKKRSLRNGFKPNNGFGVFKPSWYDRYDWLCGSPYKQSLHCWPCLLFGEESERWECDRMESLVDTICFEDHEKDVEHVKNNEQLKKFKLNKTKIALRSALIDKEAKVQSEENVSNHSIGLNRQSVELAVSAILVMIKNRFQFLQDEFCLSASHAEFVKLLLAQSKNDELKSHFRKIAGYPNPILRPRIQSDILESIAECIEDYIVTKVKSAEFFSIRIDDGPNELNECSIFLRCVNTNHQVTEYFLGYYSLGTDKSSLSLFRIIDTVLEKYQYKSKLIGISFDITFIKFNYIKDLRVGIKFMAQEAIHVNLLGHSLDYMLERCLCSIPTCRIFFANLNTILTFVHQFYSKGYFGERALWRDVSLSKDSCCSKFQLLSAMVDNWSLLKNVLLQVQQEDTTTKETLFTVSNILERLKDMEFILLCAIFNYIFQLTNPVGKHLRASSFDAKTCQDKVKEICVTLYRQRNEAFYNTLQHSANLCLIKSEIQEVFQDILDSSAKKNYKPIFFEILDNTIMELHTRFENIDRYHFLCLGDTSYFQTWRDNRVLVRKLIDNLVSLFPKTFKLKGQRLEDEWYKIACNKRYCKVPLSRVLGLIAPANINGFHAVYKMFCVILLLSPMKRDSSTPCLHKIGSFLNGSVSEKMRPAMAKILMNQEVLDVLEGWFSFKDDIMNKLSQRFDVIKLLHMVKKEPKIDVQGASTSQSIGHLFGLTPDANIVTPESSMVVEIDPAEIVTPDLPDKEYDESGPSMVVEPDSSMVDDVTLAMTCEQFPVSENFAINIKQEPEDPSDILTANVERELSSAGSLFQPPVLIKEEIVSEDEL